MAEEGSPLLLSANKWRQLQMESDKIFRLAGPMMFSLVVGVAMISSNQMFAGHLSSLELSAISLAGSVGSLPTGILSGLVSAQETLCGQAFGAGQVALLSIYLQRSWIVAIGAAFILSPLYIFTTPILKMLGQHEAIAELAGRYAIRTIPHLFGVAVSGPMQKFIQSQRKVGILAWIGLLTLIVHVGLSWLFVSVLGWGFDGLAAAYNISAWVVPFAQLTYIAGWRKDSWHWHGLSSSAFREIWSFLRLSVASAMSMCVAASFQMVLILILGHLKKAVTEVAAFSICMNIVEWVTTIATALNVASSVRVSNELGSGRVQAAKYVVVVIFFISLAIGTLSAATVLALRNQIGALFTNDEELQKTIAGNALLLTLTLLILSLQTPLSGAAVGVGLQVLYGYISFISSYLIGLPVAIFYGFILKGGLEGVWFGITCGLLLHLVCSFLLLWKIDWNKQAARVLSRLQACDG